MPGKAKRSRGKRPSSKKGRAVVRGAAAPAITPAAAIPVTPAERPTVAARPAAARPAPVKTSAATYPYFVPELKRIGILAVIIIVILVVLSFVLT
jgi:hypothetical protein